MLLFPFAQAAAVLAAYAEIVAGAPDELTVLTGFLPGPQGPSVFLCPFWCGSDLAAGERAIAALRSAGHPFLDHVAPMPPGVAAGLFARNAVPGNHYLLRSRWVPSLGGTAGAALTTAAAAATSPFAVLFVNRFHGAATRVAPAATAFAQRSAHQVIEVIAAWSPDDPAPDRHRAWADAVVTALDPVALPGGYPNQLGPADDERARAGFGANLERLVAAKHRYDPGGTFAAIPSLVTGP
jgi:hypothetical protein